MLPPSAISVAALQLREHLSPAADPAEQLLPANQILIGHPKSAVDTIGNTNLPHINLFLYHLENAGYPTDALSHDPFFLKLYILITAFGSDDSVDNTSKGEDELRLIGAIIQRFHEKPVIRLPDSSGNEIAQLQIVPHALSLDDINHIWSAQADVPYRLSVAYEMALVPSPLVERQETSPRAGAIGIQAKPNLNQGPLTEDGLGINARAPEVSKTDLDISQPDWVPQICFIDQGSCHHTLAFDVDSPEFSSFSPEVWVAGDPGEQIELIWEIWKSNGWNRFGTPLGVNPHGTVIDPENIPTVTSTFPFRSILPLSLDPGEYTGQAILYALRSYLPPESGRAIEIRSNPLMISLYRQRPAA